MPLLLPSPAEVGGGTGTPASPAEEEAGAAGAPAGDLPRRTPRATPGAPERLVDAIRKKKNMKKKKIICIVLTPVVIPILVFVVCQMVKTSPGPSPSSPCSPPPSPSCPSGWPEFKEKCFFISEAEGGWDHGQQNCTSFNATLATIETQEERDFLKSRNCTDHWIGLRRENDTQPWRRPDGSEFSSRCSGKLCFSSEAQEDVPCGMVSILLQPDVAQNDTGYVVNHGAWPKTGWPPSREEHLRI